MERFIMEKLKQWKTSNYRKPIILEGAYRVGKTWIVRKFAETEYSDMLYIDLKTADDRIRKLLGTKPNTEQLFLGLELILEKKIDKSNSLIVFDEIQKMPEILENIGCFYKDVPEYHVICISSQMDLTLGAEFLFLRNKVEVFKLYPMSFQEFFLATQKKEDFKKFFNTSNLGMMDVFEKEYIKALQQYYFVGGMPEAVLCFAKTKNLADVRDVHKKILNLYEQFFSQYAFGTLLSKINKVWASIPVQLQKENKKFMYGLMKEGDRAKFYEEAIAWLRRYGFVHKVNRITQPEIPLEGCENAKVYKLFIVDIGLLGCMLDLQQEKFLDDKIFVEAEGALTEQYILQQMNVFSDWNVHYYANERSACEINFLIDNGRLVIPVDVRMKVSTKAKRLRTYQSKFKPAKVVQISMADYNKENQILHLPIYAVEKMITELDV